MQPFIDTQMEFTELHEGNLRIKKKKKKNGDRSQTNSIRQEVVANHSRSQNNEVVSGVMYFCPIITEVLN